MQVDRLFNEYQTAVKNLPVSAASGVDAVATIAADAGEFWAIVGVSCSYATAPTNGLLTITIGGVTVFEAHVAGAGYQEINFKYPIYNGTNNLAVVVTLADGTAAKKLNVQYM